MKRIKEISQQLKNEAGNILMWDIKLILFDPFFYFDFLFINFSFWFCDCFDVFFYLSYFKTSYNFFYLISRNITLFFGIKFVLAIMLLIAIRGGTPRYRYDYLTKLGWLKFLGLTLVIFLISLLFFFIF